MTATAHALVGGAIAAHFGNPVIAIPIALTSHFVMDSIPHWDFGTDWRARPKASTGAYALLETIFGVGLALVLFHTSVPFALLTATIIASLLPDWLEAPWYIFFAKPKKHGTSKRAGFLEKFSYAFYEIPHGFHTKASMALGLATQVVTVGFFFLLLR